MLAYIIHSLVALIAVMNPLNPMSVFLALTNGHTDKEKRQTAKRSVFCAFFIILIFLVLGHFILDLFGITIDAFRVAGGILLLKIGFGLLNARSSSVQSPYDDKKNANIPKDDICVTPLAIPMISGPGTITTVMGLAMDGQNLWMSSIAVLIAVIACLVAIFYTLIYSSLIDKYLGHAKLNVVTRLLGLIVTIIAVQMAAAGLGGLFPGLLHK